MAVVANYLVDTSVMARLALEPIAARIVPLIEAGLVATCAPLDFEALYSARSPAEYERVRGIRGAALEYLSTIDEDWHRALSIQHDFARRSEHRSVGMSDLLIAAIAERHRVTLLHCDSDFEAIAEITGQAAVRIAYS